MEKFADRIEGLLQEKRGCYEQLVALMNEERAVIIAIDVGALWQITSKKNGIVTEIEALRSKILNEFDAHGIDHGLNLNTFRLSLLLRQVPGSPKERAGIEAVRMAIDALKDEIQQLASVNKSYVQEYLTVIDDVIYTMVTLTGQEQYEVPGKLCESTNSNHFIQAEV